MSQLDRETIRLYLLGRLDQGNLAQIEERLLTDETFYDELLIAEDELTDQYLANELSDEERRSFESHFLSAPERRQKLRFARGLRRYVSEATVGNADEEAARVSTPKTAGTPTSRKERSFFSFLQSQNPIISYSFAAAVLLVVFGTSWVVFRNSTPRGPHNVITVVLTPGLTRDVGAMPRMSIPTGTDTVQMHLALSGDTQQTYKAALLTSERETLWIRENLKPSELMGRKLILLDVPAAILKRGDYQWRLSSQLPNGSYEDTARYAFRVNE